LKNPPILILDEATSALDTHTERDIQAFTGRDFRQPDNPGDCTPLSTIVDADEILVLEGGQIVERGNHESLLQRNGAYAVYGSGS